MPTICDTLSAEILALTKLEEFKTKIDRAWCPCQKCCDKQKKSNEMHYLPFTLQFFLQVGALEGGRIFLIVHRNFV